MAQHVVNAIKTITSRLFAAVILTENSLTQAATVRVEDSTEEQEENQRKFMQLVLKKKNNMTQKKAYTCSQKNNQKKYMANIIVKIPGS